MKYYILEYMAIYMYVILVQIYEFLKQLKQSKACDLI